MSKAPPSSGPPRVYSQGFIKARNVTSYRVDYTLPPPPVSQFNIRKLVPGYKPGDKVALVNAANGTLLPGSGIDEAIHKLAGPKLGMQTQWLLKHHKLNALPTGSTMDSAAHDLAFGGVYGIIHTVGPIKNQDNIDQLKVCCLNILQSALDNKLDAIVIPNISSKAFGFPPDQTAKLIYDEIERLLKLPKFEKLKNLNIVFNKFPDRNYLD